MGQCLLDWTHLSLSPTLHPKKRKKSLASQNSETLDTMLGTPLHFYSDLGKLFKLSYLYTLILHTCARKAV